jgi:transposase-like protein
MIQRLIGKEAVSALQLSRETGLRQQTLSHWLREARSLPLVVSRKLKIREWPVERKARLVAEAAPLAGDRLQALLDKEGVALAEFERWRNALDDDAQDDMATARRIRQLERELARKERALAEAAALLVLKKRLSGLSGDEDDDMDESSEK